MKTIIKNMFFESFRIKPRILLLLSFSVIFTLGYSQDTTGTKKKKNDKPVRSPFESGILINNQTIIVPSVNTFEMDIQHRFGTVKNGINDLYGIFAPSNIRMGFNYSIMNGLLIGFGTTKNNMLQDFNVKWNFLKQTRSGSIPIAITYFGNFAIDARARENYPNAKSNFKSSHRLSYFHQIIIARKFNRMFSLQIAPSFTHYNLVDSLMRHDNIVVSLSGRVKISPQTSIIFEYDRQITKPDINVPKPNLGLGIEISTGSHAFQIFLGSFNAIINQKNNVYNSNDFTKGEVLLGFNITRLWNF